MKALQHLHQRFLGLGIALAGILVAGTLGYRVIEGWPVLDAVYMTVITITSVGFTEVHPLSTAGRVFTIGLIVVGLGVVGYGFSTVTAFLLEGALTDILRKGRMEKKIAALRDHMILVGGGETGRHIVEEFLQTTIPFVLIEKDAGRPYSSGSARSCSSWATRPTPRSSGGRGSARPGGSSPPSPRTRTTCS